MNDASHEQAVSDVICELVGSLPEVTIGEHFGHTNFSKKEKVFAWVRDDGSVVMKVPRATADQMIETQAATRLVMGKRAMKEWIVVTHEDPGRFRDDEQLLRASMEYALEGKQ